MIIQVNTDHHITGRQELTTQVEEILGSTLGHFASHITRVEVHLNDVNSRKKGPNDKRCVLEARLEGHAPVAASHQADTLTLAVDGAAEKLHAVLDHTLGRLQTH